MNSWSYEEFTAAAQKLINIDLSQYNERQMKRRINSFLIRSKHKTYNGFYQALITDSELRDKFINFITINVTEFFRNIAQWEKLRDEIIPFLKEFPRPLKIWSSACSTGEEPYSVAMLLADHFDLRDINILATDIDDDALAKAKKGAYDEKAVKKVPRKYLDNYFRLENQQYFIKDEIKARVKFKKINLLVDPFPINCHLILSRNVMIYFTQEAKEKLYKKFYNALIPGGILFLGNTEQIINAREYGLVPLKSFFYVRDKW